MLTEREIVESCVCVKVRAAARSVTNAYDEALRATGLRATQFALLAAVSAERSTSITALAQLIGVDRTTLSRNLGPLEKSGLVKIGNEGWHRSRMLEITPKGKALFKRAIPLWEGAQNALRHKLGERTWTDVSRNLTQLANVE